MRSFFQHSNKQAADSAQREAATLRSDSTSAQQAAQRLATAEAECARLRADCVRHIATIKDRDQQLEQQLAAAATAAQDLERQRRQFETQRADEITAASARADAAAAKAAAAADERIAAAAAELQRARAEIEALRAAARANALRAADDRAAADARYEQLNASHAVALQLKSALEEQVEQVPAAVRRNVAHSRRAALLF